MRESDLSKVLLVKAVEEADRTGALLPFGDRERAAREALRSAGIGAEEVGKGSLAPAAERALADRAERLAQPLLRRDVGEIRDAAHVTDGGRASRCSSRPPATRCGSGTRRGSATAHGCCGACATRREILTVLYGR